MILQLAKSNRLLITKKDNFELIMMMSNALSFIQQQGIEKQ